MIGVFVTFRFEDNFDEQAVRKIAQGPDGQFKFLHLWAPKFPHPVMQDVVDF